MEFQLSYFKSWKILLLKCCTQYARKFGKLGSSHRTTFIPVPKKGNAKECSNYRTITLISHASKVVLEILQARLQQYMNQELPGGKAGFKKGRGSRNQIASICWIIEKAREFQKNIYFCFDYAKAFDCVNYNKLWKILLCLIKLTLKEEIQYTLLVTVKGRHSSPNSTVLSSNRPPDLSLEKPVCRSRSNS